MFGNKGSGKKKSLPPTSDSKVFVGAVKSNIFSKLTSTKKSRFLLCLIIIIGILAILAAVLIVSKESKEEPPVPLSKDTSAISSQVEALGDAQTKSLAASNPNPKKDLNWSYAKAQALARTSDYQGAVKEYQAIVTSNTGVPYYIYRDLAVSQSLNGDLTGAVKNTQLAIDRLKTDNSISSDAKQTEQHLLEAFLKGYQSELGQ